MPDGKPSAWRKRLITVAIALFACTLACALAYRLATTYDAEEVMASIRLVSVTDIALGAVFAGASYTCLTFFDWLGLRYIGRPQSYPRAALVSFTSLSIGHTLGLAALSSGAVRYRLYSRWGLTLTDIAKLVAFCGATVGLGLTTVAGLALLIEPSAGKAFLGLDDPQVRLIGIAFIAVPAVYLLIRECRSLTFFSRKIVFPSRSLAAAQIAIGTLNYLCVAGCLYQMVAVNSRSGYADVAAAYVIANAAAIVSHVPGGVGVLESVALYLIPGSSMLGGLVMFRILYYFVPLVAGLALFATTELIRRRRVRSILSEYLAPQQS